MPNNTATYVIGRDDLFSFTDDTLCSLHTNEQDQLYEIDVDWKSLDEQLKLVDSVFDMEVYNFKALGMEQPSLVYQSSALSVSYAEGAEGPDIIVVNISASKYGSYIQLNYDDRSDIVEIDLDTLRSKTPLN